VSVSVPHAECAQLSAAYIGRAHAPASAMLSLMWNAAVLVKPCAQTRL
jgi:hypothetical protein